MKKNLIKNVLKTIFFICLFSCNKKDDMINLNDKNHNLFTYKYRKDTIFLTIKDNMNNIGKETFIKINNDYYENGDTQKLFFSTSKDTTIYSNQGSDVYKIKITKKQDNIYQTTSIMENYLGEEIILRNFYYDNKYRILKVE